MKLFFRLIVSAACIATLGATIAAPIASQDGDAHEASTKSSKTVSNLLRGPEPYVNAELNPLLDESELIPLAAEQDEQVAAPGSVDEESLVESPVLSVMPKMDDEALQVEGLKHAVREQSTPKDCVAEFGHHLRSSVDPDPVAQMYFEKPIPSNILGSPQSGLSEIAGLSEKARLRGPE